MESDIELKISFRFLELSEKQATALRSSELVAKFGTHFKTKSITGIVPLNVVNINQISIFIDENNISKETTDIFISFVTEYDTRIIDIPSFVNQAVIKLSCKLVLSYTIA